MKRTFSGKKPKLKKESSIYEDFIKNSKVTHPVNKQWKYVDPASLNLHQRKAYNVVKSHIETEEVEPLRVLVTGVGGSGKSHLIHSLRPLFTTNKKKFRVFSFTGQ